MVLIEKGQIVKMITSGIVYVTTCHENLKSHSIQKQRKLFSRFLSIQRSQSVIILELGGTKNVACLLLTCTHKFSNFKKLLTNLRLDR
jgi:hypothetical protein